jgi:hypothetical protein
MFIDIWCECYIYFVYELLNNIGKKRLKGEIIFMRVKKISDYDNQYSIINLYF